MAAEPEGRGGRGRNGTARDPPRPITGSGGEAGEEGADANRPIGIENVMAGLSPKCTGKFQVHALDLSGQLRSTFLPVNKATTKQVQCTCSPEDKFP